MKILVLVSRFPYPLEKGDKLRAFYQIEGLSKEHEVVLVSLSDQEIPSESFDVLHQYCSKIFLFRLKWPGIFWALFQCVFNGLPFQVGYFYRNSIRKKIDTIIQEEKPDLVYCQLIRMAEYVKDIKHPKVLDFMDVFSIGVKRRSEVQRFPLNILFKNEKNRLLRYEKEMTGKFSSSTVICLQDKSFLPSGSNIHIVPNGVSFNRFQPMEIKKDIDILFTGNMNYPPNIDGALFLVNEILPLVRKKYPDVKVVIAGAQPHPKVKNLGSKGVQITGWVDDISLFYNRSRIFIAPMRIGSGMQNKLLEAMAIGIPCVSTLLAADPIKAINNETIITGENAEALSQAIIKLLENKELRSSISRSAFDFVRSNYSWDSSLIQLQKVFNSEVAAIPLKETNF